MRDEDSAALALLGAMKRRYEDARRGELECMLEGGRPAAEGRFARVLAELAGASPLRAAVCSVLFADYLAGSGGHHEVGRFVDTLIAAASEVQQGGQRGDGPRTAS